MANVPGAYCETDDLRVGDMPAPSNTTRDQYVSGAAEEIDAAIGHLYVTPIVIEALPENRPSILFLKKLNWLLASGRFVSDVAAASQDTEFHSYAARMLREANDMLKLLTREELVLTGADRISEDQDERFTGPMIHNEDAESLVEGFYKQRQTPWPFGTRPVTPYGK